MNPFSDELMLRQGAIFRLMHEFDDEGEKYRFFIILNYNPQSDKIIVLVTTTTQLAKLERRYRKDRPSPLVYISPSDCDAFTERCVANCKVVEWRNRDDLLANMKRKRHKFVGSLPDAKLQEIHNYIAQAQSISLSLKALILEQ